MTYKLSLLGITVTLLSTTTYINATTSTTANNAPVTTPYDTQQLYNYLSRFNYPYTDIQYQQNGISSNDGTTYIPANIPQGVLLVLEALTTNFVSSAAYNTYNLQGLTYTTTTYNNQTVNHNNTQYVGVANAIVGSTYNIESVTSNVVNAMLLLNNNSIVDINSLTVTSNNALTFGSLTNTANTEIEIASVSIGSGGIVNLVGPGTAIIGSVQTTNSYINLANNMQLIGNLGQNTINLLPLGSYTPTALVPSQYTCTALNVIDTNADASPIMTVQGTLKLTGTYNSVIFNINNGGNLILYNVNGTVQNGPIQMTSGVLSIYSNGVTTTTTSLSCDSNSVIIYYVPSLYIGMTGTIIQYSQLLKGQCNVVVQDYNGNYAMLSNSFNSASGSYTGGIAYVTANAVGFKINSITPPSTQAPNNNSTSQSSSKTTTSNAYTNINNNMLMSITMIVSTLLYSLI